MVRDAKMTLIASCALAALFLFIASPAWATEEHVYDPILSLTGSTAVSAEDEVPDPGSTHPPKGFETPCGTATDPHGDIYVATPAVSSEGEEGRIDVFNPQGEFLTEIADESKPCGLAADSAGNLYVVDFKPAGTFAEPVYNVRLYSPPSYPPPASAAYTLSKVFEFKPASGSDFCAQSFSVAVDPSDDHLYIGHRCRIEEYGSAAEGSSLVDSEVTDKEGSYELLGIDVDGETHDTYAAAAGIGKTPPPDRVFVFDGKDGHAKCEISGSETPAGGFEFASFVSVAVDQANGDLYVWDFGHKVVDQFAINGAGNCPFVGQIPPSPALKAQGSQITDLAVDDPIAEGEPGYDSPNKGYVYVTSGTKISNSHLFAFEPKVAGPPAIKAQSAVEIGETEAALRAELNPTGLDTHYHFEYMTEAAYIADGESFSGPELPIHVPLADADAGAGGAFMPISVHIAELQPDVSYRFRLVASNCEAEGAEPGACMTDGEGNPGGEGESASFSTYAPLPISSPCTNEALRAGPSAALPDCRAYELVTPPDTNGRIPTMTMLGKNFGFNGFETPLGSPDGESVVFGSNSGSLPGIGGGGYQDTFEALRNGSSGWQSQFTGMSGAQAERDKPGGLSADHGYAFFYIEGDNGSLAGVDYQYLRAPVGIEPGLNCAPAAEPEGRFEWVGCGGLGFDPYAQGLWISPGGGHVVFETGSPAGKGSTPVQLETCAPPSSPGHPVRAIYDRAPGGATRCVSVPPAEASAGTEAEFESQSARYLGTAADGTTVAFEVGTTMYVGIGNEETLQVSAGNTTLGGISEDGSRLFYLEGGDIFVFDTSTKTTTKITSGGESSFVNVSADGSHVYFISKDALTGGEENEAEEEAEEGEENLYVWDGSGVRFIAIVEPLDVSGEFSADAGTTVGGLGLWTGPGLQIGSALDPSRTSRDGGVFVFESHAQLTRYSNDGNVEIYRFDADAPLGGRLRCVSCNPTGAAAESDAQLQSDPSGVPELDALPPVNELAQISNVSSGGPKVFFQSGDRLVNADLDGKVDVYEWEAQGIGGCKRQAGCLSLISGGRGVEDDYLYAATPDGHDVFFLSADRLVPQDPDGTPSIYDARVEGGFPSPGTPPGECLGEACQPAVVAPSDTTPTTLSRAGSGNQSHHKKRHRHRKRHRRAHDNRRAAR